MKTSQVITKLIELIAEHGDCEIWIDDNSETFKDVPDMGNPIYFLPWGKNDAKAGSIIIGACEK